MVDAPTGRRILYLYTRAGLSARDIGPRVGLEARTVQRYLGRQGVPLSQGRRSPRTGLLSPAREAADPAIVDDD